MGSGSSTANVHPGGEARLEQQYMARCGENIRRRRSHMVVTGGTVPIKENGHSPWAEDDESCDGFNSEFDLQPPDVFVRKRKNQDDSVTMSAISRPGYQCYEFFKQAFAKIFHADVMNSKVLTEVLISSLELLDFLPNETIMAQGALDTRMFIIERGQVGLLPPLPPNQQHPLIVGSNSRSSPTPRLPGVGSMNRSNSASATVTKNRSGNSSERVPTGTLAQASGAKSSGTFGKADLASPSTGVGSGNNSHQPMQTPTRVLETGDMFGELGLIFDSPRPSPVVALTECRVWALERSVFKYIQRRALLAGHERRYDFLREVSELCTMSTESMSLLSSSLTQAVVDEGECIFSQGELSNKLIVIDSGVALCEVAGAGKLHAASDSRGRNFPSSFAPSRVSPENNGRVATAGSGDAGNDEVFVASLRHANEIKQTHGQGMEAHMGQAPRSRSSSGFDLDHPDLQHKDKDSSCSSRHRHDAADGFNSQVELDKFCGVVRAGMREKDIFEAEVIEAHKRMERLKHVLPEAAEVEFGEDGYVAEVLPGSGKSQPATLGKSPSGEHSRSQYGGSDAGRLSDDNNGARSSFTSKGGASSSASEFHYLRKGCVVGVNVFRGRAALTGGWTYIHRPTPNAQGKLQYGCVMPYTIRAIGGPVHYSYITVECFESKFGRIATMLRSHQSSHHASTPGLTHPTSFGVAASVPTSELPGGNDVGALDLLGVSPSNLEQQQQQPGEESPTKRRSMLMAGLSTRASLGQESANASGNVSRANSTILALDGAQAGLVMSLEGADLHSCHSAQNNNMPNHIAGGASQRTIGSGTTLQMEASGGGSVVSRGSSARGGAQSAPRMGSFSRFADVHVLKRGSMCQVFSCRTTGSSFVLSGSKAPKSAALSNSNSLSNTAPSALVRQQYRSDASSVNSKYGTILASTMSMNKKAQKLASYIPAHVAGGRGALSSHNSSADKIRWVDHFYSDIPHEEEGSQRYVLKVYNKAELVAGKCMDRVLRECFYLHRIDCPFICKLEWQFQTVHSVCMVLEAAECGDLFRLVHGGGPADRAGNTETFTDGLPTELVRYYGASILLALHHLHTRGMVYRNLKLENVMLDDKGYIKLVGLGLVKKFPFYNKDSEQTHGLPQYRTFTVCGTTEYFAPEQVLDVGHEQAADMWALGVLLHELLLKSSPFMPDVSVVDERINSISRTRRSSDPAGSVAFKPVVDAFAHVKEIMNNVMMLQWNPINLNHERFFHSKDSMELKALIEELLVFEPQERLTTSRKSSRNNVFHHVFFDHFDWDALDSLQYNASYLPFRKMEEFRTPRTAFGPQLPGIRSPTPSVVGGARDTGSRSGETDVEGEEGGGGRGSFMSVVSAAFGCASDSAVKYRSGSTSPGAGLTPGHDHLASYGAMGIPGGKNSSIIDEGAPFTGDQAVFSGFNFD